MNVIDAFLNWFNPVAWVLANVILAYIAVALILFVAGYYALFDPKATTGGKFIFRFMLSLVGVIGLVFLGIFIDPAPDREWYNYAAQVEWWRPAVRLFVYGYVAYTITSLAYLLAVRKWNPGRLKTAPDRDLVKVRHTSEIPIVIATRPNSPLKESPSAHSSLEADD